MKVQFSNDEVEAFLAVRPWYALLHVQEIAEQCARNSVPFCTECNDWHAVEDEHSS